MTRPPAADYVAHPPLEVPLPLDHAEFLLEARQLTCRVEARVLWRHVDLTLAAGERLGITGRSGSGKTMLLRTLAGLEAVQSGALAYRGRATGDWPMPAYRTRVMYLPQRPALRGGNVEDALRGPFAFRAHRGTVFPIGRTCRLLATLGREADFLRQRCERLSGGEAQIVALLRALLLEPQVLLLDEPTVSMDTDAVAATEAIVADWLAAVPERACIWISHDRAQLERICARLQDLEPVP